MDTEDVRAASGEVSPAEDRNRQLAAAAWILGWVGGPLPAVAMLLVTRTPPWSRRLMVGAAVFWAAMWVVFFVLVALEVSGSVPAFAVWWIAAILLAFGATIAATRLALRRSEASGERAAW
jgi:hypothetical protein